MKTLQQLSDRMEIEELFTKYAYAIDEHKFDDLEDVFMPDSIIDYTAVGGPRAYWPDMKPWLVKSLTNYASSQHPPMALSVELKGDEAFTKTVCFNPMVARDRGGIDQDVCFYGIWYYDHLVRTPKGWRIKVRREKLSWTFNCKDTMLPIEPYTGPTVP